MQETPDSIGSSSIAIESRSFSKGEWGIFTLIFFILAAGIFFLYRSKGLPWFFVYDLFHQIFFYFGTVVAMGILLYEKYSGKPLRWSWVAAFFLFCLFVSCYQAWVDEHRNSDELIKDKLDLSMQLGFWKGQSYSKEEGIRSRDQLLFQSMQAATVTLQTANQTQRSLTNLSAEIFDITKPQPIRIDSKSMLLSNATPSPTLKWE